MKTLQKYEFHAKHWISTIWELNFNDCNSWAAVSLVSSENYFQGNTVFGLHLQFIFQHVSSIHKDLWPCQNVDIRKLDANTTQLLASLFSSRQDYSCLDKYLAFFAAEHGRNSELMVRSVFAPIVSISAQLQFRI